MNSDNCHQERVTEKAPARALQCSHCKEVYQGFQQFLKHVHKLYPAHKVNCPACTKTQLVSFTALRLHWLRNHKNSNDSFDKLDSDAPPHQEMTSLKELLLDTVDKVPDLPEDVEVFRDSFTETSEPIGVFEMRQKMSIDAVAELTKIKSAHGISGEAMTKIVAMFTELTQHSEEYMKDYMRNRSTSFH